METPRQPGDSQPLQRSEQQREAVAEQEKENRNTLREEWAKEAAKMVSEHREYNEALQQMQHAKEISVREEERPKEQQQSELQKEKDRERQREEQTQKMGEQEEAERETLMDGWCHKGVGS